MSEATTITIIAKLATKFQYATRNPEAEWLPGRWTYMSKTETGLAFTVTMTCDPDMLNEMFPVGAQVRLTGNAVTAGVKNVQRRLTVSHIELLEHPL